MEAQRDVQVTHTEQCMSFLAESWDKYPQVKQEYDRLVTVMGNVDGDEILQLVLVAADNVYALNRAKSK